MALICKQLPDIHKPMGMVYYNSNSINNGGQMEKESKGAAAEITGADLSKFGKYLSAQRRQVEGVCPICGTKFTGTAKKKYDKHSCAVIASRRKRKAEQAEGD